MSHPIPVSVLATRREIAFDVTGVFPPIPDRRFDYCAVDDSTYDGADDSHCPQGAGATPPEAINDLLDQLEEA